MSSANRHFELARKSGLFAALIMVALILAALPINRSALAEEAEEGAPSESGFIALPMLNIQVAKKMKLRGLLTIECVLDVQDAELASDVEHKLPLLQDEYNRVIGKWASRYQDVRAPANVIAIKRQLQAATDRVLKRGGATVLLQHAMMRRAG